MVRTCFGCWIAFACVLTAAADVRFAEQPTATRSGERVTIRFAASAPTDCAVAVLDASGKVVRHLAAGMLGPKAPAPLQPGLAQTLTWDRRDDAGTPVPEPGKCAVRVSLGLSPAFDRILGWRGESVEPVVGLAVDGKGQVFVLASAFKSPTNVHVFARSGRYLRTIMPYPAGLPAERVGGLPQLTLAGGRRVPAIHDPISFAIYPDAYGASGLPPQTMAVVGDRLVMTNSWKCLYAARVSPRRLLILNTDGGVPANYLGPTLSEGHSTGYLAVAGAPDGKHVFVGGLSEGEKKDRRSHQVVYRVALDSSVPPEVYLGELDKAGADEKHFDDPRGVAVDRFGNLYVADHGNNRVAVFGADGRFMGQVGVERPDQIAVHQRSGALYVCSGETTGGGSKLLRLTAAVDATGRWVGGGKVTASLDWPYACRAFAVDGTADPTIVWVGTWLGRQYGGVDGRYLFRIEETDGRFGPTAPVMGPDDAALVAGGFLAVDRTREEVYVRDLRRPGQAATAWLRIDGRSGRATRTAIAVGELTVGPDGNLYVAKETGNYGQMIGRLDRDGKPVPFEKTGTNVLIEGNFLQRTFIASQHCERGLTVAPSGDVYVLYPSHELKRPQTYDHCTLVQFGPDGQMKRKQFLWASNAACSIRVDAAGNLYIAENVKPKDRFFADDLAAAVPIPKGRTWLFGKDTDPLRWYPWMCGSVVKFPPEGGAAKVPMSWAGWETWKPLPEWHAPAGRETPEPVECASCLGAVAHVQNAVWMCPGMSPAPSACGACVCLAGRFDLDGFGRVFMPDAAACCVRVVDANANPVATFGEYGNMDCVGPGSAVPAPAIAFAWPQCVAVSDEAAYVSDVINRRVVRVKLGYRAQEQCPVR